MLINNYLMTDAELISILILKWYPYLYLKTIFKMCKNTTKNINYQSSPQQKPNYYNIGYSFKN